MQTSGLSMSEPPKFESEARILVVVSPYYSEVAERLRSGAIEMIEKSGAVHEVAEVPGALEIAPAIKVAAAIDTTIYHGFVALGCVIRGETSHYETVCAESARGLTMLGLGGILIGNGILTVETHDQAIERADPSRMNKGGGAALAALHLVSLRRRFQSQGNRIGFQKAVSKASPSKKGRRGKKTGEGGG